MEKAISFCFQKENKTFYYNERNKPMLNLESLKFMIVHVAYSNVIQKLRHAYFYFFIFIFFLSAGMHIFMQTKIKYVNDFFF